MNKLKKITCALLGHPRAVSVCFGYEYCGRCGEQLGDSLGGVGLGLKDYFIIGHDCKICRKNYKKLKWHEKLFLDKK